MYKYVYNEIAFFFVCVCFNIFDECFSHNLYENVFNKMLV